MRQFRKNINRLLTGFSLGLAITTQTACTTAWDPSMGIGDTNDFYGSEVLEAGKRQPVRIVGKFFKPEDFAKYVKSEVLPVKNRFKPNFIVLHHTGIPSLKQRPTGFEPTHMPSLANYYGMKLGWSGGPHLFIDQNGIWVFSPLIKRGTHAPSWNGLAWGIEMLGNYSEESFFEGSGAKVRANAIQALAILSAAQNIDIKTLHLHKWDPKTTHKECPGEEAVGLGPHGDVVPIQEAVQYEIDSKWKSFFLNSSIASSGAN